MAQLREQYTQKDKELIKEILRAKDLTSSSQKSEPPALAQKMMIKEKLEETIFRKFKLLTSLPFPHLCLTLMTTTNYALIIVFNSHIDALLPLWTFPKDLNNEQLVMMLTNHPILMGADYHDDIGRLKRMLYDHIPLGNVP